MKFTKLNGAISVSNIEGEFASLVLNPFRIVQAKMAYGMEYRPIFT